MKKVFRKIKIVQDESPRNHARNVITGKVGSSVSGTTKATSSTGHLSSSEEDGVSPLSLPPPSAVESGGGWTEFFKDIGSVNFERHS